MKKYIKSYIIRKRVRSKVVWVIVKKKKGLGGKREIRVGNIEVGEIFIYQVGLDYRKDKEKRFRKEMYSYFKN